MAGPTTAYGSTGELFGLENGNVSGQIDERPNTGTPDTAVPAPPSPTPSSTPSSNPTVTSQPDVPVNNLPFNMPPGAIGAIPEFSPQSGGSGAGGGGLAGQLDPTLVSDLTTLTGSSGGGGTPSANPDTSGPFSLPAGTSWMSAAADGGMIQRFDGEGDPQVQDQSTDSSGGGDGQGNFNVALGNVMDGMDELRQMFGVPPVSGGNSSGEGSDQVAVPENANPNGAPGSDLPDRLQQAPQAPDINAPAPTAPQGIQVAESDTPYGQWLKQYNADRAAKGLPPIDENTGGASQTAPAPPPSAIPGKSSDANGDLNGDAVQSAARGGAIQDNKRPNPQRLMGYAMGQGAVHPKVAEHYEGQVDPHRRMDPAERTVRSIAAAPDAKTRAGMIQHHRMRYNLLRARAKVAMRGSQQRPADPREAAKALTMAHDSVPDGNKVSFQPNQQGGLDAQVQQISKRKQDSFASGGMVQRFDGEGDPEVEADFPLDASANAPPAIPDQPQQADPGADALSQISSNPNADMAGPAGGQSYSLSPQQVDNFLDASNFDKVMTDEGIGQMLRRSMSMGVSDIEQEPVPGLGVSGAQQGQAQPGLGATISRAFQNPTVQGLYGGPKAAVAPQPGAPQAAAPAQPSPQPQAPGATPAPPAAPPPAPGEPHWGTRPTQKQIQDISNTQQVGGPPQGNPWDKQLNKSFDPNDVAAARAAFGYSTSGTQKAQEWLLKNYADRQKQQAQIEAMRSRGELASVHTATARTQINDTNNSTKLQELQLAYLKEGNKALAMSMTPWITKIKGHQDLDADESQKYTAAMVELMQRGMVNPSQYGGGGGGGMSSLQRLQAMQWLQQNPDAPQAAGVKAALGQ